MQSFWFNLDIDAEIYYSAFLEIRVLSFGTSLTLVLIEGCRLFTLRINFCYEAIKITNPT